MALKPLVSIVFAMYNEQEFLPRLLTSIRKQTYPNIEVIAVDDSSHDESVKVAKKYTNLVFARSHMERSVQRNFGVSKAKGKYVLILDADMELDPNVVSECIQLMSSDPKLGEIVIPEVSIGKSYWERVKAFERSFYQDSLDPNIESARFFLKEAFTSVGGYDTKITGPEDWDLSESVRKSGYGIAKIKSVIYHHERLSSLSKHFRKFYRYGLQSSRALTKQKRGLFSSKSIHFLRPQFYKDWRRLLNHPILSVSMVFLLSAQIAAGGLGYITGRIKHL